MPIKRADSPASGARIVGHRYRDELDHHEQDSKEQLRQHGFESSERPCTASADEQKGMSCATKHTPCKLITWFSFHIHRARGVRDAGAILHASQANSRYFSSGPNGVRYRRLGEPTVETDKGFRLDSLLCPAHQPSGARCVSLLLLFMEQS